MTDDYKIHTKTVSLREYDELSLPNGSDILDHYRAGQQHVLIVATPLCGVNDCSRTVSDVDETCYQHTDD